MTNDSSARPRRHRGVYERIPGSNIWWIRWADAEGRIHREKVGPRELAISAYQKRKTQVREQHFFPSVREHRVTFGELADDFKRAKPNHWSKKTFNIARAWFADVPAASITPQKIQEKLNSLKSFKDKYHLHEKELAPATINRYRAILSAVFSWAVRNGRVSSSPMRAVPVRREQNQRIRFLENEEENRLREVLREIAPDREPELVLSLHTGIRQGELLSLAWDDVDLKRNTIHLKKTKSGRSRSIPLNLDALQALRKLKMTSSTLHVVKSHPRPWFERALILAKIENFRWHDLRHTFASRLVMAGVNLRTVQELLGHQTITMTLRYAHLAPAHLRDAVNALSSQSQPRTATQPKNKASTSTPTGTAVLERKRKTG